MIILSTGINYGFKIHYNIIFMKNKKLIQNVLFLIFFFFLPKISLGIDIFVPEDLPTIQGAIEAAEFGDTIRVRPGGYYERIVIKAGISLVSDNGPDGEKWVNGPGEKQVLQRALQTIIDEAYYSRLFGKFSKRNECPNETRWFYDSPPSYQSGFSCSLQRRTHGRAKSRQ